MSQTTVTLRAARDLAAAHGMFVVAKEAGGHTDYILCRRTFARPVRIGKRQDEASLLALVRRAAQVKP